MFSKMRQLHKEESGISLPELIITSIITAGIALLILTIFATFFRTSDSVTIGAIDVSRSQVLSSTLINELRNASASDGIKVSAYNTTTGQQMVQARTLTLASSGTPEWRCVTWVFGVTTPDGRLKNAVMQKTGKEKITAIPTSWTGWGNVAANVVKASDKNEFASYSSGGTLAITYSLSNQRISDSLLNLRIQPQAVGPVGMPTLACW